MKYLMIFMFALLACACDAQVVVSGNPPNASHGDSYSTTFTATGGSAPYTYSVNPAPFNLLMNQSTGVMSGTISSPVMGETYTFTVSAMDSVGTIGTQQYTITVGTGGGGNSSDSGGCTAARGSGLRLLLLAALTIALGAGWFIRQWPSRSESE